MGIYIDIHTHHPTSAHPSPQGVGIHPWHAASEPFDEKAAEAASDEATLIGEIGLDFACDVDRSRQEQVFRQQLRLAERLGKAVVLHCVRAFEPMMKILGEHNLPAVIFHGFIGSVQQAERAIGRGYYLSFGEGAFRSPKTLQALRHCPLEKLFAETDQSDVTIETIYERIARERGISVGELQERIEENYNKIFLQHNGR